MSQLIALTDNANQQQTITLPDGSEFTFVLTYNPTQQGWFFLQLSNSNQDFLVNTMRASNNPNILRQWKNTINFGLSCYTVGDREPSQLEDFASGASKLSLLSQAEVAIY